MHRRAAPEFAARSRLKFQVRLFACMVLLTALAACGSHPTRHTRSQYNPSRYYPPPGSATDPWGPYIHEASGRFGVPELWIRRVMRQESGGQEDVVSWAGAMGLMQVMPDTYDDLRGRYSLGDDPFDPHNNVLAGTAYLREMYDRFGAPGFLAAYNAGPNRLDRYLNNGTPLPAETVSYVASIAPQLGPGTPMSGPLAVYGSQATRFAARSASSGCDPDAAYNPNGPCTPRPAAEPPVIIAATAPVPGYASYQTDACDPDAAYDPARRCLPATTASALATPAAPIDASPAYSPLAYSPPAYSPHYPALTAQAPAACDPDAAFDPSRACQPLPDAPAPVMAQPLPQPNRPLPAKQPSYAARMRPLQERMTQSVAFDPGPPPGRWGIQVGAFASLATAQAAAENARAALPDVLRTAKIELPPTTPFGSQIAFRARLSGLSPTAASDACARLNGRGTSCMTVPPARSSF